MAIESGDNVGDGSVRHFFDDVDLRNKLLLGKHRSALSGFSSRSKNMVLRVTKLLRVGIH